MHGKGGEIFSCPHCGGKVHNYGLFCPYCGRRTGKRTSQEKNPHRNRKRVQRLIAPLRCSAFQHELMLRLFRYRFCPECGMELRWGTPGLEPL